MNNDFYPIIQSDFPGIKKEEITIYTRGYDHVVWVVSGKFGYRFPKNPEYMKRLPSEAAFLQYFSSRSPVAVPRFTIQKTRSGQIYATFPFIAGEEITEAQFQRFTHDERLAFSVKLGQFLTALHSVSVKKATGCNVSRCNPAMYGESLLQKVRHFCYPTLSPDERTWIEDLFSNYQQCVQSVAYVPRVIHGDIGPMHLLMNPATRQLCAVIDFGDMCIGDAAYDFTLGYAYGESFMNELYSQYESSRDPQFDTRRVFYERRRWVNNYLHAVRFRDGKKQENALKKLRDVIRFDISLK